MLPPGWPFPGLVWGSYPQQRLPIARRGRRPSLGRSALERFARAAHERLQRDPPALDRALADLRQVPDARRDAAWLEQALLAAAQALREALGLLPHWQQLMAARALLDQRLAEMATGEGKTVAIALAAATAALARTPVHVVTANDYLAERDARRLQPFYRRLGLVAGFVTQPMAMDARRAAYAGDVAYCTARELAFDYLRDALLQPADLSPLERSLRPGGRPVLRGLCMAILDEADTLLVDEARMPLVLSQPAPLAAEERFLQQALELARGLCTGVHFRDEPAGRGLRLTAQGQARVADWPADPHPLLGHPQHRAATVELALAALHRLHRDRDYVLRDGQVLLVDEATGRAAQGRAWSRGLHQLVELKEGVPRSGRNATVTQLTFQQFFVRYLKLAGISGTLGGAGRELRAVYGLQMVRVPSRLPRQVRQGPTRLFRDSDALWRAVAARAGELRAAGRPVLIGTGTVRQSEALSAVLAGRGLPHRVLNARQDREESAVVAAAGQPGCITVATSMAGRGTDVEIGPDVAARGGLHVILCQLNASARIDRQFLGRTGRQGQPGSCEVMVALDFELLQRWLPPLLQRIADAGADRPWMRWWARVATRLPQALESYTQAQQRVTLARLTETDERALTFSRWGIS